ncbi:amidase [Filobacillus milosensis]|uniref:Amidase n=1 Tax=Filobacillus milosensis TaxID=94137 RepID=A0A4Y8IQM6_9BACI|nr:amidase [Filobacillus milosensis]TFB22764.1 amidase [Filobacillus milosensis]
MTLTQTIQSLDALGQKRLIDQGEITPLELTEHYINQIKELNPKLNAVVHPMFEDALAKAENHAKGPGTLNGLPYLIKDLNSVKGHPATNGSKLLKDFIAPESDMLVNRFEQAGLNFLGKTNTPEFGFLPTTEPELFGPTKNPWDLDLSPGGSSGGAAAAVASGMVPFAHASDGGGSIRIPASCCGLFGMKPSRGRMPYAPYIDQLSVNHAVTKSVRDSAALLDILKGGTPTELYPTFNNQEDFLAESQKEPGKLRIAVAPDWGGQVSIDEDSRQAINQTAKLLEDLGHEVESTSPNFDFKTFTEQFIKDWVAGGSVIIKHLGFISGKTPSAENLEAISYDVFKKGTEMTALEYEEARVLLHFEAKKILSIFSSYDMILTPVLNSKPVKTGSLNGTDIDSMYRNMVDYVSFTPIANVTGQPAMSVPLYWTNEGVPIGSHFMGRLGDEATLFQLAHQLEQAQPWMEQYLKIKL